MEKLSVILTAKTLMVMLNGTQLFISKKTNPSLFESLKEKVGQGDNAYFVNHFVDIKNKLETYSSGTLETKNNKVFIRGTNVKVPKALLKKFRELDGSEDTFAFLTLMNFWKKLAKNPSKRARKELYNFITRWNIPLMGNGDMVLEKGVDQKADAPAGVLVDCYSGMIDNSVGQVVSMPREEVDNDSNSNCSFGLHVSSPSYVRNNWSSDIIVEVIVNPEDVVSIPKDYNSAKMRVCKYVVAGYSDKTISRGGDKIVKLEDFVVELCEEEQQRLSDLWGSDVTGRGIKTDVVTSCKVGVIVSENVETNRDIENMSAREIVEFIKNKYDYDITFSLKSKKSIVKKALEIIDLNNLTLDIASESDIEEGELELCEKVLPETVNLPETISLSDKSFEELLVLAKSKFNLDFYISNSKKYVLDVLTHQYNQIGFKVI